MKFLLALLSIIFFSNTQAKPIGLISSGGVSLGSYEAGVLQEFLRSHRDNLPRDLKVVMGASAGGMNGLLTLFEACREFPSTENENLLWKMWIPIGLDQLEDDDPNHESLFHREALTGLKGELSSIWKSGFKEDCDVIFGVTVTRRTPLVETIRPGLSITRQPEIFLVKIKGRGKHRSPLIENYRQTKTNSYRTILPLNQENGFETLFNLVQASAAFPIAFSPYPISFCLLRPGVVMSECSLDKVTTELFVDGGIYQNSPVGRGYMILKELTQEKDVALIYVNASAPLKNVTQSDVKGAHYKEWGFLSEVFGLSLSFLETSRSMGLSEDLQRFPDISQFVNTNEKGFPLVSEPLYAFMGFIEKDFRISDFYLGVRDGYNMFGPASNQMKEELVCFFQWAESGLANCKLRHNLIVLAKLAHQRALTYPHGEPFNMIFSFLEKEKFHFKDLGLNKKQSSFGRVALKNRFSKLANAVIEKQPRELQTKTGFILEQGLNQITFYPKAKYSYILLGKTAELGLSRAYKKELNIPTELRLNLSLMFLDFQRTLESEASFLSPVPSIGFRFQPSALADSIWQMNLGLRVGYVFSGRDNFGSERCDIMTRNQTITSCSGILPQGVFSVTFLERLRAQFVYIPDYPNNFGKFHNSQIYLQAGLVFSY